MVWSHIHIQVATVHSRALCNMLTFCLLPCYELMHMLLQSFCTENLSLCGTVAFSWWSSLATGPSLLFAAALSSKRPMSPLHYSLAADPHCQPACLVYQQQVLQQPAPPLP